jgi:hypothetical protein
MLNRAVSAVAICLVCVSLCYAQRLPDPAAHPEGEPLSIPLIRDTEDTLKLATKAFNRARDGSAPAFSEAKNLFDDASKAKQTFNEEQKAAWAYCRIKLATDRLNSSTDSKTASEVATEIEDALSTAPGQKGLAEAAGKILSVARQRAGTKPEKRLAALDVVPSGWKMLESNCFRVLYRGDKTLASQLLQQSEDIRVATFKKWSGPPGGDWRPKCDVYIHDSEKEFRQATSQPANATGRAEVKLADGQVSARRIDLRADDDGCKEAALPREITYVVLADLFPTQPPPKWVELGMAALNTSDAEVNRYLRTAKRMNEDGDLLKSETLLMQKEVPAKAVTAFHVQSVALVDFLVRLKGEKALTAYLRDSQRYGQVNALQREYGFKNAAALEDAWRQSLEQTSRTR